MDQETRETQEAQQSQHGQAATQDPEVKQLVETLVALNAGRADYYRGLSYYYFQELTQEQVDALAEQDFGGLDGGDALLAEGYKDIHAYLRKRNSGTRQELAVDYAHTFLAAGNYETFAATPYESVFKSELGLMMQESRDEVYKMYCAEHIQPDEELRMPEDHVSFEFQFLAHLLEKLNGQLTAGDFAAAAQTAQTVKRFHREHQLNWIDDLCDTILDVCQTRFYRGISKITRGFVHMETQVIQDELEVLEELVEASQPAGPSSQDASSTKPRRRMP